MINNKVLVAGIGNSKQTKKFYDNWSTNYDKTLYNWNYKAPKKTTLILKSYKKFKPKKILDLACGTGLFGQEISKIYTNISIDGLDISKKILDEAKIKNIYNRLICANFDAMPLINKKYDLVSCIGAMTYSKNPLKLLLWINKIIKKNSFFIFTHRVDLLKKQNFEKIFKKLSKKWKVVYLSRPILYLPKNKEFKDKIKIKIILLKKI